MRLLRATGLLFLLCALRWSHGAKKEKAERIKGGVQTPENATASAESAVQTLDIEHAFGFGTISHVHQHHAFFMIINVHCITHSDPHTHTHTHTWHIHTHTHMAHTHTHTHMAHTHTHGTYTHTHGTYTHTHTHHCFVPSLQMTSSL